MRTAFVNTLCERAAQDDRIWLLTGDLGFSVLEPFIESFPERYVNVGVAEQNMIGIAAGLALSGKIVFIYSIANFPIMRCLEQIRNDACVHNANVKIVTVGGGYTYGAAGYTHHGVEDLAVTLALPNMTVVAPADQTETRLSTKAIAEYPGPCFMRLGKNRREEDKLYEPAPNFRIGEAIHFQQGRDLTFISTGEVLDLVVDASNRLVSLGYSINILSMPCLSPLDHVAIENAVKTTNRIITIEEHGPGGLGSLVAEVVARMGEGTKFIPIRLKKGPMVHAGSRDKMRSLHGLSVDGILEKALNILEKQG